MAANASQTDQRFVAPILGKDTQALLITLNQKLSNLGIDGTIKLPSIAVLGDQSTSKSSLIKAISNVDLPTGSGTCTRCPIFISLSSGRPLAGEWECSVYIDERYYYDKTVRQKRVTNRNPLGPWKLREEPVLTLIETTEDRGRLLDIIQHAQNQILNTNRNDGATRSTSTNDLEKFSPNVIKVEITVKDCPELSFIDLPGVIANSGTDYHVDLIKGLAASYVRDENNILCLCLPVNHDVSNSNSFSIVRNDGGQSHTMAIFTKVDIARPEERDDCLRTYFGQGVSSDEEEEFEYGHHIVMLKDVTGSGQTVTEAEDAFFSEQPWNRLSGPVRDCLGVTNLIDRIRKILFQKTAETLPGNLELLTARITDIQDELKDLPLPPDSTELPWALDKQMFIFENNMKQLFSQTSKEGSPRSTLIDCMREFHQKVTVTAKPKVKVKTRSEVKQQEKAQATTAENTASGSAATSDNNGAGSTPPTKSENPLSQTRNAMNSVAHTFSLEEIRQLNNDYYSSLIPGDIELKAVVEMHRLAVKPWDKLFIEFMEAIKNAVKSEVLQCVHKTFNSIIHLPAYEKIEAIAEKYVDHVIGDESNRLFNLCASERSHPLTFNDASMTAAEAKSLAFLRERREEARLYVEKDIRKATANGRRIKEPTAADIGADEFDLEICMAAKSRAYFEVASHRFVDTVCLNIHAQLIPQCEAGLATYVKSKLGLDNIAENRANLVALMTEDSEREALRRRKLSELERLQTGYNYISNVLNALHVQSGGVLKPIDPLQAQSDELQRHVDPIQTHSGRHQQYTDADANFDYYEQLRGGLSNLRTNMSPNMSPNKSPNKRKISNTEEDFGQCSTPTKRQRETILQHTSQAGPSNSRSRLPSRPRSVNSDEG